MRRSILIWGPRHQGDRWTNEVEDYFRWFGWEVHRTPRYYGKGEAHQERDAVLKLARQVRANVFLTNHAAWVGGPSVDVLNAYREAGMVTAAISQDEPYRWDGVDDRAARQAPGYDVWFTNWNEPRFLEQHTAKRVVYAPCAAREEFTPHPTHRDVPISFIGMYYSPRDPYLEAVADLGLKAWMMPRTEYPFHRWPPTPIVMPCLQPTSDMSSRELAHINRRSQICLDISEQPDGRVRCPKNRLFESMGVGSFTLAGRCPQIEEMFRDGEHCVLYDDTADLRRKAEYYLERPARRERMGAAAAREVAMHHTWLRRCQLFARELEADLMAQEKWPKIGVVIPTNDRPELVMRAIASVSRDVPVVVVDTGEWEMPRGRYTLVRKKGANASAARNAGVVALPPDVEWVRFLDDDDMLRAGWIDAVKEAHLDGTGVSICGALSADSRDEGPISSSRPYTSQIAVRRDVFNAVGGFDPECTYAEERELLRRLINASASVTATELLLCYKGGEDERPRRSSGFVQKPPRNQTPDTRWSRF